VVEVWIWVLFGLAVGVLLLVDLLVAGRAKSVPSLRRAAAWSVFWTALALAFAVVIAAWRGGGVAGEYLAGYMVERSLSLDNLFVFALVFAYLAVPGEAQRRVLVFGIAIAIVLRAVFILVGAALLAASHWTLYAFGAFLLVTAVRMARHDRIEVRPERNPLLRVARRIAPMSTSYHGDRIVTSVGGRRIATPLLAALLLVASLDVVFAVDSIPAIFAITRDTFVVFAANAFSLLGMTSLFFLLAGMVRRFRYLNYGLAAILAFVGAKMLASDVVHISPAVSLGVIAGALGAAVLASNRARSGQEPRPAAGHIPSHAAKMPRHRRGTGRPPRRFTEWVVSPIQRRSAADVTSAVTGRQISRWRSARAGYIPLLWRVFALNAGILAAAVVLTVVVLPPHVLAAPAAAEEIAILGASLALMLAINLLLLRQAFAPLRRLTRAMRQVDLLRPGQRVPVDGSAPEVTELASSFNEMLARLETERRESASRALAAQEAERLRVAQELHDEVGQSLTAVLLDLARSERRAPGALQRELREIQESVRASLDEARRIALELRPEALDDLGLPAALLVLARRLGERAGIEIEHDIDRGLPSLDYEQELVLYRVAQEALTNVVRHASASRAELCLRQNARCLELRVRDDGQGLGSAPAAGGGIRGMRERALMVGAALEVHERPQGGVEVSLDLPLEAQW